VEDILAGCFLDQVPARLIGDNSDRLNQKLAAEHSIEMIVPTRRSRLQKTQDAT